MLSEKELLPVDPGGAIVNLALRPPGLLMAGPTGSTRTIRAAGGAPSRIRAKSEAAQKYPPPALDPRAMTSNCPPPTLWTTKPFDAEKTASLRLPLPACSQPAKAKTDKADKIIILPIISLSSYTLYFLYMMWMQSFNDLKLCTDHDLTRPTDRGNSEACATARDA